MTSKIEEKSKQATKTKIKQLREAAHPEGNKGLWLRLLSDRQLAEVYERLRLGQPLSKIVRIAQIDWGVRPNASVASLTKGLKTFRERVLGELEQMQTQERPTSQTKAETEILTKKGKRVKEDLDALGHYRWMIDIQSERLEMIRENEKNMGGVPVAQFDKAAKQLRESLNNYMAILVKLGIIDSTPDTSTLEIKTSLDKMIDNMAAQGGGGMVHALGNFLKMADKEAIPLLRQDDGSFSFKGN